MNNMNLIPVYPEIFLLIATSVVLLIDMFVSDAKRHLTYYLTLAVLAVCFVLTLGAFQSGETVYTFHNMFVSDSLSSLLKLVSYVAVAITLVYSRRYVTERGMVSGHLGGRW